MAKERLLEPLGREGLALDLAIRDVSRLPGDRDPHCPPDQIVEDRWVSRRHGTTRVEGVEINVEDEGPSEQRWDAGGSADTVDECQSSFEKEAFEKTIPPDAFPKPAFLVVIAERAHVI